jgi:hypothetical protein
MHEKVNRKYKWIEDITIHVRTKFQVAQKFMHGETEMKKFACYQSDALLKIFMNIVHCIICPFILLVDFSCSFSELLIIVRTTWEGGCTRCVLYYY